MKSAVLGSFLTVLALAGCVTPDAPEQVGTHQGKPLYQIHTSMQAYAELDSKQLQEASKYLETQNEHGALPYRASQQCPQGYKVVKRTAPESKFIMVLANGIKTWRVSQVFSIVCEG